MGFFVRGGDWVGLGGFLLPCRSSRLWVALQQRLALCRRKQLWESFWGKWFSYRRV